MACLLDALSDELHRSCAYFLSGKDVARAGLRRWRAVCDDTFWRVLIERDLKIASAAAPAADEYRRLASPARAAQWCWGPSSAHGLRDRVAAPQMFLGPDGRRLYNYGGWTRGGPQTDLSFAEAGLYAQRARGEEGAAPRFRRVAATGIPARRAGAQTLTPLWTAGGGGAPSFAHVKAMVAAAGNPNYAPPAGFLADADEGRAHLVLAYGGGGGGYVDENNDFAVGVLVDRGGDDVRVHWARPEPNPYYGIESFGDQDHPFERCAHTATFVPARCFPGGHFPEGCVVFFGGHYDDARDTHGTVQVMCVKTWEWFGQPFHVGDTEAAYRGDYAPIARMGHSATLYERSDGSAYIVLVGGGTGVILGGMGRGCSEFDHAQCVDVSSLLPVRYDALERETPAPETPPAPPETGETPPPQPLPPPTTDPAEAPQWSALDAVARRDRSAQRHVAEVLAPGVRDGEYAILPRFLPPVRLVHDGYVPGRHHTASRVAAGQLALYGGGHRPTGAVVGLDLAALVDIAKDEARADATASGADRAALNTRAASRVNSSVALATLCDPVAGLRAVWNYVRGRRPSPEPRKFHAAAGFYPFQPLLVVFGGWRYNPHFADLWVAAFGRDAAALEGFGTPEPEAAEAQDLGEVVIAVRMDGELRRVRIDRDALMQALAEGMLEPMEDGSFAMRQQSREEEGSSTDDDDDEVSSSDDEVAD